MKKFMILLAFAPLLMGMSGPIPATSIPATPIVPKMVVISLRDYMLVSSDGWVLADASGVSFTDMYHDPVTGFWIWTVTINRTIADVTTNGGIQGLAVNFIAPAYANMIGVQRNVDSGTLNGYASPGLQPSQGWSTFPPNTMPMDMNLPVLQPSQMATTAVTPGSIQAFPWEQVHRYQMAPSNCAILADDGPLWTRNHVFLVANYPIGGDVGTPPLTLILETEQGTDGVTTLRIERYAFVPGFGLVWQEQAFDSRTPQYNGIRSQWNTRVPNTRGHLVGPLCPLPT